MQCPKCQFDHKLQTTECLKCGIVFSRYRTAQEAAAKKFMFPVRPLRRTEPRYWFTRSTWWPYRPYPVTREAWLVSLAMVACGLGLHLLVDEYKHPLRFLGMFFGLLALYLAVVDWKTEPKRKFWDG
jgi:hypothetical protein